MNIPLGKCSNDTLKVVQNNFKHLENPYFSLRNNLRSEVDVTNNERTPLPTQIKNIILPRKVYNVGRIQVEKTNFVNKTGQRKSPEDKRNQEKVIHVQTRKRDRSKSIQRFTQENNKKSSIANEKYAQSTTRRMYEKTHQEWNQSEMKPRISSGHRQSMEYQINNKIWEILRSDLPIDWDDEKHPCQVNLTDSEMNNYIISVIIKNNKEELKHCNDPCESQTSKDTISSGRYRQTDTSDRRKFIKREVRRHLWQWLMVALQNNERWSKFFAENHIALDNINIVDFDLSCIDVDALGIENKLLKRTIALLSKR
nr:uncharacterized protein LOC110376364 isoform X1 [Helicoverpa armigera]